jgi:uncharacterized repeat protein (TIGR03803 family)
MRELQCLVPTAILAIVLFTTAAQAGGGLKVLHSFAGGSTDGANPFASVTPLGKDFVVPTDAGGTAGKGTLTLIRPDGTFQLYHSFIGGSDGQNPDGTLADDGTQLYGNTTYGGSAGCGTYYILLHDGSQYRPLQSFPCGAGGAFPFASQTWVTQDGHSSLISPTINGGSNDLGTIFAGGDDVPLHSFDGSHGSNPYGAMAYDPSSETFFATASAGGSFGFGTVVSGTFTVTDPLTVLHHFAGSPTDGATPYGSLLFYNGNLYGTTYKGGASGLGTVFRIGATYTVLHSFQGIFNNTDGSFPHGGLTLNPKDGMLYGMTQNGGNSKDLGTIFKIDPNTGAESVVHAFKGKDGAHPIGDLLLQKGSLYGTTVYGGAANLGVVFKLKLSKRHAD